MTKKEQWKYELIDALKILGGKAKLSQIYDEVERRGRMDLSSTHWNSRVRDTLEVFSSDSAIFNGLEDLFYSVAGIRRGVWGLRSLVGKTPKAIDFEPEEPQRVQQDIYRILRDTDLARQIKSTYDFECQICGSTIDLPNGGRYAEAHHVKPLGRPHNGPDQKDNIVCLCPTCHVKLDYGVIELHGETFNFHKSHVVNADFLNYHNNTIYNK